MKINIAVMLAVGALTGEPKMLEVKFTVQEGGGHPVLQIALANHAPRPVKVLHALATEAEMFGKLFEVRDAATGQLLEYQGIMVKRGPLSEADYLAMKPGAQRSNRIDLAPAYGFKPGRHAYTISYAGHYLMDGKEIPLTVGPVRFEHTGR
ncbi:hypothetical protein SAMN05518865_116114 [Duganella sp. CF458]|uniref:hypothetical protein n=1 Tax=Duganella sp. CF458 TaxID=1884368 RepID=UPI0008E4130D|nr:hypothetical protein [Duganella sp. CF458]SFG70342.1 hypothetical protein SAMN05518865_116114 [Duganella sp. CF458]